MQTVTPSKPRRGLTIGLVVAIAALGAALIAAPAQAAKDRNHDKIPDRWEREHDLSLKRDQAKRDQDRDGLKNLGEFEAGLDPRDGDTDDDGTHDGDEGAGAIASFDAETGALTIDLFNGGELAGTVNDNTEIKCEDEGHHEGDDDMEDHGGNSGPGGGDDDEDEDHGGNSGPGGGDDRRSHDDDESNCGVENLVPGTVVSEAEVEASSQGAIFEEIELR
jgi:hypothetical protein